MKKTYILITVILAVAIVSSAMIYRNTELDKLKLTDEKNNNEREQRIEAFTTCINAGDKLHQKRIADLVNQAKDKKDYKAEFPDSYRWDLLEPDADYKDFEKEYANIAQPLLTIQGWDFSASLNYFADARNEGIKICQDLYPLQ